mmetsp:Transcript_29852/g.67667  ORF Transcript_29852/g.67667 Transcript_29852/m.67667 type:complete len:220 (-) Transcript_29852:4-663(-)
MEGRLEVAPELELPKLGVAGLLAQGVLDVPAHAVVGPRQLVLYDALHPDGRPLAPVRHAPLHELAAVVRLRAHPGLPIGLPVAPRAPQRLPARLPRGVGVRGDAPRVPGAPLRRVGRGQHRRGLDPPEPADVGGRGRAGQVHCAPWAVAAMEVLTQLPPRRPCRPRRRTVLHVEPDGEAPLHCPGAAAGQIGGRRETAAASARPPGGPGRPSPRSPLGA